MVEGGTRREPDPMRREPRGPVTDGQKDAVAAVKNMGHELWVFIDQVCPGREGAIAKTELETAIMWAVKAITTPEG